MQHVGLGRVLLVRANCFMDWEFYVVFLCGIGSLQKKNTKKRKGLFSVQRPNRSALGGGAVETRRDERHVWRRSEKRRVIDFVRGGVGSKFIYRIIRN